jgi:hypothetical protein
MDQNEMASIIKEAMGRVEDVLEVVGVDLLGMATNLAKELKDMGYDIVRAAEGQEGTT